MIEFSE